MRKKSFVVLVILLLMLFTSCGSENVNYIDVQYYSESEYAIILHEESTTESVTDIITEEPIVNPLANNIEFPQNAVSISTAHGQNLAIMADGSLWSWGEYCVGWFSNVGDGIGENTRVPVKIMTDVVHAVAGPHHSLAITADGGMYTWGGNSWGNLGDGTTIDRDETPVRILENIAQVLAVGNTVYAIGRDGTLWGWGNFGASWGGNILLGDGSEFITPDNTDEFWEYAYTFATEYHFPSGFRWLLPDCGGTELRISPVKIMENVVQVAATYYMFDHGWIRSFRTFAITENGEL